MEYLKAKICLGDNLIQRGFLIPQTVNYGIISIDEENDEFHGVFTFDYMYGNIDDKVLKKIVLFEREGKTEFELSGTIEDAFGNAEAYWFESSNGRENRTELIFFICEFIKDQEIIQRYEKKLKELQEFFQI